MPQIAAISSGVKSLMCSAKTLKFAVCASTYCRSYSPSPTIVLRMPLSIATSVPGLNCSMCVAWRLSACPRGSMTMSCAPRLAACLKKVAATGWFSVGLAPMTMMTSEFLHSLKVAVTAPHAEPVLVCGPIAAADIEELVVLDVIGELASHPAIRAHAVHLAVRELGAHIRLVEEGCGHQRASRTGLHALATGDAGRFPHGVVEIEYDLFAITAAGHADHVVDLHLAASADAEIALNAGVEIDRHRRVAAVGNRRGVAGKPAHDDILPLRGLPEFRLRIARHVLGRLIGKQQLQHHATRRLCAIGLRLDLHAGRRHTDAACCEHTLAFDLHHADATVAVGAVAGPGQVA